jgi:hypothetical protein
VGCITCRKSYPEGNALPVSLYIASVEFAFLHPMILYLA